MGCGYLSYSSMPEQTPVLVRCIRAPHNPEESQMTTHQPTSTDTHHRAHRAGNGVCWTFSVPAERTPVHIVYLERGLNTARQTDLRGKRPLGPVLKQIGAS